MRYHQIINEIRRRKGLTEMNAEDPEDEFEDEFEDVDDPDDPDDDEEDHRYDALPSSAVIRSLKPAMVEAAQKVYDNWLQDEDDDLNGGGICHLIADKIAGILGNAGFPASTQTASDVQHVYVVAQCNDGVFEVDIPYHLYERGSMFTWTKLPDIQFTSHDISVYQLDGDPSQMHVYVEEWEEE
jgi:hypothetical protein